MCVCVSVCVWVHGPVGCRFICTEQPCAGRSSAGSVKSISLVSVHFSRFVPQVFEVKHVTVLCVDYANSFPTVKMFTNSIHHLACNVAVYHCILIRIISSDSCQHTHTPLNKGFSGKRPPCSHTSFSFLSVFLTFTGVDLGGVLGERYKCCSCVLLQSVLLLHRLCRITNSFITGRRLIRVSCAPFV